MRHGPGLYANQHRMFERTPDIAAKIGGDHKDARRPHQKLCDVSRPTWRVPNIDPAGRAVLPKTIADEDQAEDGDKAQQSLIPPFADAGDDGRSLRAHGHESMGANEDDQPENEDNKAHGSPPRSEAVEAIAGLVASGWSAARQCIQIMSGLGLRRCAGACP